MINIQQVDTTQQAAADSNSSLPEATNGAQPGKKTIPMLWIPATLCVGLLIAAIYLGGRIVTAHPQARSAVKKAAPAKTELPKAEVAKAGPLKAELPNTAPAPVTGTPVVVKTEPPKPRVEAEIPQPASGEQVQLISPKEGERYIQIGALDQERTRQYLVHLREANLAPHVAPGPTPELLRILIGPFSDQNSLITAKSGLDTAGIENFVREY